MQVIRTAQLLLASLLGYASTSSLANDSAPDWVEAGRLGMLQFIVVPQAHAGDEAYHKAIIKQLCPAETTCFLRFFTNSQNAPVGIPLDDRILAEPTATFQQSVKQQNQLFQWSCRLGLATPRCF